MKAQELRIGNYLQDFGGNIAQVIHLTKDKTILESPIPLTEEWLLKFGFKYSEERASMSNGFEEWENNGIYIGPLDNEKYILEALDQGGINNPIKYVHQLQNLYFVLTGEELKIKP